MTCSEFEQVLNHCAHLTKFWLFLRVGEFCLFVLLTSRIYQTAEPCQHIADFFNGKLGLNQMHLLLFAHKKNSCSFYKTGDLSTFGSRSYMKII